MSYSAPAVPDIVQEHLEEYAFLSIQRRRLLFDPEIALDELVPHEERIEAHWDGLVIGGAVSVELSEASLAAFDPWVAYAAARVWLELGDPTPELVVDRISEADDEHRAAWREALRKTPGQRLSELFPQGPSAAGEGARSALAYAWGWHGMLRGPELASCALGEDPSLRWSVARAMGLGAAGLAEGQRLMKTLLEDPEEEVRRAAAWSGVLLDSGGGLARAREAVRAGTGDAFTVRVLGLLGSPAEEELLVRGIGPDERGQACIRALGDLGGIGSVGRLIELAGEEDEATALAAADALRTLMGEIRLPEDSGPARETAEGRDVPNVEALRELWADAQGAYRGADRWLRGHAFPWNEDPEDEPMEALWRRSLVTPDAGPDWLRREVPDGFFSARPVDSASPGE